MVKFTKLLTFVLACAAVVSAQPAGGCGLTSNRCVGTSQEYATIQAAADAAVAGDTVYVFLVGSPYTGFQITTGHVSGAAGNPITFHAETGATINVAGNVAGDGINVNDVNYVVVDNFTIGATARCGIKIALSTGSVVKNNVIAGSHDQDILAGFTPLLQVLGNTTSGAVVQHGIYISNSDKGYDGIIVRGNITHDNALNGIQFNGDCTTPNPSGFTDGMLTGLIVENNISYNNGSRGFAVINVSSSMFRNNLLYGNSLSSTIALSDQGCNYGNNNNVFVNNTIYAGTGTGFRIVAGLGNVIFNNIVVANSFKCVIDATTAPCDGSVGGNNYAHNLDLTTSTITGVFTNQGSSDYTLAGGSSAIGAAVSSYVSYAAPLVDLLNNGRPVSGTYDAGAYEFGGTSAGSDTTAPTTPGTVTAVPTAYQVGLSWSASTDAFGVIGYSIYRNAVPYASSQLNSYIDATVVPGTTYTYDVYAYDAASNISAASSVGATVFGQLGCMNADNTIRTYQIPRQIGDFTFELDSKPFGVPQSVIALSTGVPVGFSDMAVIVAYLNTGTIVARNGSSYTADITLNWNTSVSYHFRFVVRIASHTYDVFVTPSSGGGELTLATNYAFRTEQASVTSLSILSTNDSGGATSVCAPLLDGLSVVGQAYMTVQTQALDTQVTTTTVAAANGSIGASPLLDRPKRTVIAGDFTLRATDNGCLMYWTGATTVHATLPTGLGAGFSCTLFQASTGVVQIVASGLTITPLVNGATHTVKKGSPMVLQCLAADDCYMYGDVQ